MIEAVGPQPTQSTTGSGLSQLGSDAFLKLLVAQLRYQNPMSPGDGTEMLQQTAQFTTVETLKQISEINQQLMGFQQVTMALTVVGKQVSAITPDGYPVEGLAESVRFTADGPLLRLENGLEVPMQNVVSVGEAGEDLPPIGEIAAPEAPPEADDAELGDTEAPAEVDPAADAPSEPVPDSEVSSPPDSDPGTPPPPDAAVNPPPDAAVNPPPAPAPPSPIAPPVGEPVIDPILPPPQVTGTPHRSVT